MPSIQPGDVNERDRDGQAEEDLGEAGVRGGNRRRQEEEHRQAAEHALHDDRAERGDAEPPHPAPRLGAATARPRARS